MANRNRSSRRTERRAPHSAKQVRYSDDGVRTATAIAVAECEDCGGGIIVLVDEEMEVFAEGHFPSEPDDWLTANFIPALLMAADSHRARSEAVIRADFDKSLLAGIPLEIEWGDNDARRTQLDLRSIGLGGSPRLLSDAEWIAANTKMISELGAEAYLRRLLESIKNATPSET